MPEIRKYADGTEIYFTMPWGWNVGGKALCPDGVVRKLKRISPTADTFFSIPCSIEAFGKTVAGYCTVQTRQGLSTDTPDDPAVLKFFPYLYRKNGHIFDHA